MPIDRTGPTPPFWQYVTEYALVPKSGVLPEAVRSLTIHSFRWIEVPTYQRGISWDISNIEELLESKSVLLGNVILGQFSVDGRFQYLPEETRHYTVLVDGLQRLCVGTIMLAILHRLVLSETPLHAADAGRFNALTARCLPLAPIYQYNDMEFANHPREAIAGSYTSLRRSLERSFEQRFSEGEGETLAEQIVNLFLNKQIAMDIYYNFGSPLEIMNTFLGINTVRVDLGPVDLLRAYIVERASGSEWNAAEIEEMENKFTDLFSENYKPRTELLPFVSVVLKQIAQIGNPGAVFPSWSDRLLDSEVHEFLEFVEQFMNSSSNGYVLEIRDCGAIPLACILSYYYRQFRHVTGQKPGFFDGRDTEDSEMHMFVCATYRVLFDGNIGRTRVFAEQLFDGTCASLSAAANDMSMQFLGRDMNRRAEPDWLKTRLKGIDRNKAKRVFNALRLPEKDAGWGGTFRPDVYGTQARHYNVDHLIPSSITDRHGRGAPESQTLANLAPLPANQNRVARATSCSSKLAPNGLYENYISAAANPHPYCEWLVSNQGSLGSDLDRQELLEPNQNPDIGTDRIEWIAAHLIERL